MPKAQLPDRFSMNRSLKPILAGIVAGTAATVAFLLLFAVIITSRNVPQAMIDPMAIFSVSVGAFVAGFYCTRVTRTGGLLHGAISGVIMVVILLTVGMIMGGIPGIPALFRVVFIMLSSMIGGVLGVNTKKRPRR